MNLPTFGKVASERAGMACDEPKPDNASDAAWLVLEAANDLADGATVEACRRVIDANLNGALAAPSDLHVVLNYFR